MSALKAEAFAQYEGDVTKLTQSDIGWAAVRSSASLVIGGGRDNGDCLRMPFAANDISFDAGARMALAGATVEAYVHEAYLTPQYPAAQNNQGILHAWTAAGQSGPIFNISVAPSGAIEVYSGAGSLLGTSAAGVVTPGAQQAIAMHFVISASIGEIEVRLNGASVPVLHLTSLNLGSTGASLLTFNRNVASGGGAYNTDVMDIFINDNSGTENTGFNGDPRLTFLRARADFASEQGWTPQRREIFGTGVIQFPNNNSGVTAADASAMRVGAGDFTVETFGHFVSLPSGSNKATLFSKWLETGDVRSWQLFFGGASLNSNHLELRVSTDGTAATVSSPISVSWSPIVGRRYHIAVQVASGLATLYIDGIRQNAPVAFPTPADNSALFCIGGQQFLSLGTMTTDASFMGFMDEFRFTKGVARYGSGFAVPTSPYGRNSTDDPNYTSVVLLIGADSSISDESQSPRVLTTVGGAIRYAPDDAAPGNYKVILHGDRDDTYVEAPFLAAQGIQTYTINPTAGDTSTIDGNVYTFTSPLTNTAGHVLIGATIDDTINNLVAAVNGDAGAGTLYGTGTATSTNTSAANRGADQLVIDANTLGSAGNSIVVASSNSSNPWSGATLLGGADIPDPSSFVLDRLPPHTVSVLAAVLIHRSRKTDSGDCNVQPSLVTNDGSSQNGVDQPLTTNFVYYNSIFETDPGTMGGLTPSTFINARIRLDRTQ